MTNLDHAINRRPEPRRSLGNLLSSANAGTSSGDAGKLPTGGTAAASQFDVLLQLHRSTPGSTNDRPVAPSSTATLNRDRSDRRSDRTPSSSERPEIGLRQASTEPERRGPNRPDRELDRAEMGEARRPVDDRAAADTAQAAREAKKPTEEQSDSAAEVSEQDEAAADAAQTAAEAKKPTEEQSDSAAEVSDRDAISAAAAAVAASQAIDFESTASLTSIEASATEAGRSAAVDADSGDGETSAPLDQDALSAAGLVTGDHAVDVDLEGATDQDGQVDPRLESGPFDQAGLEPSDADQDPLDPNALDQDPLGQDPLDQDPLDQGRIEEGSRQDIGQVGVDELGDEQRRVEPGDHTASSPEPAGDGGAIGEAGVEAATADAATGLTDASAAADETVEIDGVEAASSDAGPADAAPVQRPGQESGSADAESTPHDAGDNSPSTDVGTEPVAVDAAPATERIRTASVSAAPDGTRVDGASGVQHRSAEAATAATAATPVGAPAMAEFDGEVWEQVQKAVSLVRQNGPGRHEVSLVLRPDDLGSVAIELTQRGDDVTVRIVTQTAAAQDRLDRGRLLAELQSAGIDPSAVDISHRDTAGSGGGGGDGEADGRSAHSSPGAGGDTASTTRPLRRTPGLSGSTGGGLDLAL